MLSFFLNKHIIVFLVALIANRISGESKSGDTFLERDKTLCEQGNAKACLGVGNHYVIEAKRAKKAGEIVNPSNWNSEKLFHGKAWLEKACDLKLPIACYYLGDLALAQKKLDDAKLWYTRSCNLQDPKKPCLQANLIDECTRGVQQSCKFVELSGR